jgi:uncharacterized protein YxeA
LTFFAPAGNINEMKYILPVVSIIILIAVIGGGAFYLGQKSTGNSSITPTPTVSKVQTQTNTQPTSQISPTPTATSLQTVSAGGVLVFSAYTLSLPSGWTSAKKITQNSDMLTLTKDSYKITIYQAAGGGGGCTYSGEPPQQMAQTFSSFVEIMNPNGFIFRRGPSLGTPNSWTVCQKNASDGSFGFPTNFGNITITTPANPTDTTMAEIDSILTSINKK